MRINVKGLDPVKLLQALFNSSKPQGLGFLDPLANKEMTYADAEKIIKSGQRDFDYLRGRVMKIDLRGEEVETSGYDRDNGVDAAANVIQKLRNNNDVDFKKAVPKSRGEEFAAQGKAEEAMAEFPITIQAFSFTRKPVNQTLPTENTQAPKMKK